MVIEPDPTGGPIKLSPKKLALKQIADIKKSLDQLQMTVNSIDDSKKIPIPPKPKANWAKA